MLIVLFPIPLAFPYRVPTFSDRSAPPPLFRCKKKIKNPKPYLPGNEFKNPIKNRKLIKILCKLNGRSLFFQK